IARAAGGYVFGLARITTWLSLTTTVKSTPLALYCSMIFGAWAWMVLSSLPYALGPAGSPTLCLACTYLAYSALTSASLTPAGSGSRGAGAGAGAAGRGAIAGGGGGRTAARWVGIGGRGTGAAIGAVGGRAAATGGASVIEIGAISRAACG